MSIPKSQASSSRKIQLESYSGDCRSRILPPWIDCAFRIQARHRSTRCRRGFATIWHSDPFNTLGPLLINNSIAVAASVTAAEMPLPAVGSRIRTNFRDCKQDTTNPRSGRSLGPVVRSQPTLSCGRRLVANG
jgi:hypothetical protein